MCNIKHADKFNSFSKNNLTHNSEQKYSKRKYCFHQMTQTLPTEFRSMLSLAFRNDLVR